MDIIIDAFFVFEIFLKFFYAYTYRGRNITSFSKIAKRYIFGYFIIDIICVIPYYMIENDYWFKFFYNLRLFRLLKFNHTLNYVEALFQSILGIFLTDLHFI